MDKNQEMTLLAAVKKNGKWGFINQKGEVVIPCSFYDVKSFEGGLARVQDQENGPWRYINKYGRTNQRLDDMHAKAPAGMIIGPFKYGIAKVGNYRTKEYSSTTTVYDNAFDFDGHEEYSHSSYTDFVHGYMDRNGNMLTGYDYDSMSPEWMADEISDGWIKMSRYDNGNTEYMSRMGKRLEGQYGLMSHNFHEGVAFVSKTVFGMFTKYGYINTNGEMVIPNKWVWCYDFSEGLAAVKEKAKDKYFSYINHKGETVIPSQPWNRAGEFHEGLASVQQSGSGYFGYIDKTGKNVIPYRWEVAGDFSQGLAPVRDNDQYGFIDKTGKLVISCQWESACGFAKV